MKSEQPVEKSLGTKVITLEIHEQARALTSKIQNIVTLTRKIPYVGAEASTHQRQPLVRQSHTVRTCLNNYHHNQCVQANILY